MSKCSIVDIRGEIKPSVYCAVITWVMAVGMLIFKLIEPSMCGSSVAYAMFCGLGVLSVYGIIVGVISLFIIALLGNFDGGIACLGLIAFIVLNIAM